MSKRVMNNFVGAFGTADPAAQLGVKVTSVHRGVYLDKKFRL